MAYPMLAGIADTFASIWDLLELVDALHFLKRFGMET